MIFNLMLPRKRRLVLPKEFKEVFKNGRSYNSPCFKLFVFKDSSDKLSTFGVVVSNKVSKKAVQRNIIRRTIRVFLHEKMDEFGTGLKVAIIANPLAAEKSKQELKTELLKLFGRAFRP